MVVIALAHGNAIRVSELGIEIRNLADSFVRTFYWEKIKHCSRHKHGPRIHQQQQPRMVHTIQDHSVKVLLGIAVRIFEDAVIDPHGKRSDIAGGGCNLNSRIQCGNGRGLKSSAAGAGDVDALRINFGASQQIIQRADPIPNFPACQICTGEICKISQHGMFCTDQVVAAPAFFGIPELASLSLADRVPTDHDIAALHQSLADRLIMHLSVRRMACWDQHSGMFFTLVIRQIHQRGNIHSGQTLEN